MNKLTTPTLHSKKLRMAVPVFSNVSGGAQRPPPPNPKLQEEVKLYDNARQREEYDNRANVFSLIQTMEALEKAYIKDAVTPDQYTASCNILLDQFNAAFKLIKDSFVDVDAFAQKYMLHCPAAMERIREGHPITIRDNRGNVSKAIAEIVSLFITIMDRLRLEIRAMDELYPDVKELYETMSRMSSLPPAFEGKMKIKKWLDDLSSMQASDEISEDQVRQMLFDLESAYNDFNRFLSQS